MPSDGYSIPYLKNLVGANTVIYIRPMKSCMSKEKLPQVVTASSPFTECPKCENLIPIFSLRQHVSVCQVIEVDDDKDKELEVSVFDARSTSNVEEINQLVESTAGVLVQSLRERHVHLPVVSTPTLRRSGPPYDENDDPTTK